MPAAAAAVPVWQALAPYVISAVGSIGGAIATNRANKKLAQYSHNKNVEMWKMQNEYNSPANQMARFQAAGLNPNMIYDKGTAGNAQTMPQYQALPSSGEVFGQSIAGLQGLANIELTRRKAETEAISAEQASFNLVYDKLFKIPLGEQSIEQGIKNLNTTDLINANKTINNLIDEIKYTDYWDAGVNPNDPIIFREVLQLFDKMMDEFRGQNERLHLLKDGIQSIKNASNVIINEGNYIKEGAIYRWNQIKDGWNNLYQYSMELMQELDKKMYDK